tara:strand:- start:531 stop:782 length:252 start_codon:yes stop_codon:yes gene_type:complete
LIGVATAAVRLKRKRKHFAAIATFQITKIRISFQEPKFGRFNIFGGISATFCPVLSTVCGPRCSEVPYFKLSIVDQQQPFWSG